MYSAQLFEVLAPLTHSERIRAAERQRFALESVEKKSSLQRALFAARFNRLRATATRILSPRLRTVSPSLIGSARAVAERH
jgi:hypothetical protein